MNLNRILKICMIVILFYQTMAPSFVFAMEEGTNQIPTRIVSLDAASAIDYPHIISIEPEDSPGPSIPSTSHEQQKKGFFGSIASFGKGVAQHTSNFAVFSLRTLRKMGEEMRKAKSLREAERLKKELIARSKKEDAPRESAIQHQITDVNNDIKIEQKKHDRRIESKREKLKAQLIMMGIMMLLFAPGLYSSIHNPHPHHHHGKLAHGNSGYHPYEMGGNDVHHLSHRHFHAQSDNATALANITGPELSFVVSAIRNASYYDWLPLFLSSRAVSISDGAKTFSDVLRDSIALLTSFFRTPIDECPNMGYLSSIQNRLILPTDGSSYVCGFTRDVQLIGCGSMKLPAHLDHMVAMHQGCRLLDHTPWWHHRELVDHVMILSAEGLIDISRVHHSHRTHTHHHHHTKTNTKRIQPKPPAAPKTSTKELAHPRHTHTPTKPVDVKHTHTKTPAHRATHTTTLPHRDLTKTRSLLREKAVADFIVWINRGEQEMWGALINATTGLPGVAKKLMGAADMTVSYGVSVLGDCICWTSDSLTVNCGKIDRNNLGKPTNIKSIKSGGNGRGIQIMSDRIFWTEVSTTVQSSPFNPQSPVALTGTPATMQGAQDFFIDEKNGWFYHTGDNAAVSNIVSACKIDILLRYVSNCTQIMVGIPSVAYSGVQVIGDQIFLRRKTAPYAVVQGEIDPQFPRSIANIRAFVSGSNLKQLGLFAIG